MTTTDRDTANSFDGSDRAYDRRQFLHAAGLLAGIACMAPHAQATADLRDCAAFQAPMREVAGKVAFITGGTSGIGLGVARAFVNAGMKVVITGLGTKHIEEASAVFAAAKQSRQVHAISVDVTDRKAMEQAATDTIKLFGKVHVLVNNAGVTIPTSLSATTYEGWDWLMNVNLTGVFNGLHAFLPHIKAHGEGGQIVSTSSVLGLFVGRSQSAYSASKFAVTGLMEALRAELAGTNIGVSVFLPGVVASNLMETSRERLPGAGAAAGFSPPPRSAAPEKDAPPDYAMDPLEAGRILLRGIRNNDLYILTHPEFEQIIRDRHDALMRSIPRNDPRPNEARLAVARRLEEGSIYTFEQQRQHCVVQDGMHD